MLGRSTFNARLLLIASGTCLSLGPAARATSLNWTNPLGGSAATAANWSPAQVPTAADDLFFSLSATYSVQWPLATVPTTRQHSYRAGQVTGAFGGNTIAGQLQVGVLSGNNATLNVNGSVTVTNFVTLGQNAGSIGVLNLNNSGVQVTGANFDVIVGQAGQGTLNVLSGADMTLSSSADDFLVGNLVGGVGTVRLRGAANNAGGVAINNQAGGDAIIGVSGAGTVEVEDNGYLGSLRDIVLAQNPGSAGTVTASDATGSTHALISAGRDLHIGHNTSAGAAGTASLTVGSGAEVRTTGAAATTFVGDADGGSGVLTVNGGLFSTRTLAVDPVNGRVVHEGGEIRITAGGSYTTANITRLSGPAGPDAAVLHYQGSVGTLAGGFHLGQAPGVGRLRVDEGAVVTMVAGPTTGALIGDAPGSLGEVLVDGSGSSLSLGGALVAVTVGRRGTGLLAVTDHGLVTNTTGLMQIGTDAGSTGSVILGTGGRLTTDGRLVVGGSASSAGGLGAVALSESASLDCDELETWPSSTIGVNDAVITVNGSATLRGGVSLSNGGELAAGPIDLRGTVTGAGTLFGRVSVAATGVIEASGGPLTVGSPSPSLTGFSNAGTLRVNGETVTIIDLGGAPAGDITIAGGHLIAAGGLNFGSADSLSGVGSVTGPVALTSGSQVLPGGAGLVFNGPVTGSSVGMLGSSVTFAAGGGLTGAGSVQAAVGSEEEASITATGTLFLGADVNAGVVLNGPLHLGPHTVRLTSNNAAELGVLTTVAGGTLLGPPTNPRTILVGALPGQPPVTRTVQDVVPIRLGAFDELRGSGAVGHKLQTLPGSRTVATGPLSLLGSGAPLGIFANTPLDNGSSFAAWDGDLDTGPHTVTFEGSHRMGGTATLGGGAIHSDFLTVLGTLTGHGLVHSPVANGGVITPGGTAFGEIRVEGSFRNSVQSFTTPAAGTLRMDLSGDQGFAHDSLRVVGADAELGGTLEVSMLDAPPTAGVEYPIVVVEGGSVVGEFTTVTLPPGMRIRYRETEVVVVLPACFADFNQDGGIDGTDVNSFFESWENGDAPADVNEDGGIDGADVVTFFEAWEAGGCG